MPPTDEVAVHPIGISAVVGEPTPRADIAESSFHAMRIFRWIDIRRNGPTCKHAATD